MVELEVEVEKVALLADSDGLCEFVYKMRTRAMEHVKESLRAGILHFESCSVHTK